MTIEPLLSVFHRILDLKTGWISIRAFFFTTLYLFQTFRAFNRIFTYPDDAFVSLLYLISKIFKIARLWKQIIHNRKYY